MKKSMKSLMIIALIATACSKKESVESDKESNVLEVFANAEGAINGYDPVSYHEESGPVKGDHKYSYEWKEVTWYFADEGNLSAFKMDPEKYAPQFGGYCAFGMAKGHKASTEPDAWTVVDGKLYLNHNQNVLTKWIENKDALIEQAGAQWPNVKSDPF